MPAGFARSVSLHIKIHFQDSTLDDNIHTMRTGRQDILIAHQSIALGYVSHTINMLNVRLNNITVVNQDEAHFSHSD